MTWKDIEEWPGYQAETSLGLVRNRFKRTLAIRNGDNGGYGRVELHPHPNGRGKKGKKVQISRCVLLAEGYPYPGKGYEVVHRDGNIRNNSIENLYWGTKEDNRKDKAWHKLNPGTPRPDAPSLGAYGAGSSKP